MYHIQAIQPSIHPVLNVGGRQTCYRRGACPCPCAKRFVSCAALAPSPLRAASAMTGWPNMPGSCPQTRNGSGCMPQCHPVQPASMLEERLEVKHCKHSLIDAMSWCVDRSEGCYLTLVLVARSFPLSFQALKSALACGVLQRVGSSSKASRGIGLRCAGSAEKTQYVCILNQINNGFV